MKDKTRARREKIKERNALKEKGKRAPKNKRDKK